MPPSSSPPERATSRVWTRRHFACPIPPSTVRFTQSITTSSGFRTGWAVCFTRTKFHRLFSLILWHKHEPGDGHPLLGECSVLLHSGTCILKLLYVVHNGISRCYFF